MALSPGTRLGTYEIVSLLGAGGMGEVYRACDTKLDREVAIKVLPELFVSDPGRVARFQREAKTLAALNHPHIGGIYGLEDAGGMHALVLELVEGPTLADRIAEGPIPLDEALPIARQIAEALEAAHEQGIIHRDLKPANIKVRPDGVVKVLDFGVAKIAAPDLGGQGFLQLATMTADATRYGVILGTTVYMSPEQARGFTIDQRTDVWAFGCVLYEMLSGRSAFRGNTIPDTIAKILEREPDWQALPRSTPRAIRGLVRRCVQKDPQHRLRGLAIAHLQLDEAATHLRRRRVMGPLSTLAGATLALTIVAAIWWQPWITARLIRRELATTQQRNPTPASHEPVAVFIADFQNTTKDPAFDRTLESMLRRALEGAGFIHAYDRSNLPSVFGTAAPATLDEAAARELAVKQGIRAVILGGLVERQGNGYDVSIKATEAITGGQITAARGRTSSKDQVLAAATKLMAGVRKALGDETSESAQLLAMTSVSATSLDVVRYYAASREAAANGKFEESRQNALKAVELDPQFGVGYQLASVASRNLNNTQDAEQYIKQALLYLDSMTERERYATRGFSFRLTGDYQQCVKEYGEFIARYSADVAAHNQLALCSSLLRDFRTAVNEMRHAVAILPNRVLFRGNLALYADYASDFQTGEKEARFVRQPAMNPLLALAFAQTGQGRLTEAVSTYEQLSKVNALGASFATSGLADLAIYEGRFSDAVRILQQGAQADLTAKNPDRAARKFASQGYAELLRGRNDRAIEAAKKALLNRHDGATRFLAARIFAQAGAVTRARTEAARISLGTFVSADVADAGGSPAAEPEAYARIVEAEIALKNEDPRQAIKLLTEANKLADTWLGHFDLGLAYLKVPAFAQADTEFDRCLNRRGEALAMFFDEWPTYGFFPPVLYYQGIAREGLNRPESAEAFRAYMDLRGKSKEDPMLREVRRHVRQ